MKFLKTRLRHITVFVLNTVLILSPLLWYDYTQAGEASTAPQGSWSLTSSVNIAGGNQGASTDLLANDTSGTINIAWTAPGDDGTIGRADHYVMKYSTSPISESNWNLATTFANPPLPAPAGNEQFCEISGLYSGRQYYLAIKTYDDVGNVSQLSNIAQKYASGIPQPIPLGAIIDSVNSSAILGAGTVQSHLSVYYEFALDTNMAFSSPRVDVAIVADTVAAVNFGNLTRNISYYWHCRAMAVNHTDSSLWSNPQSFVVGPLVGIEPGDNPGLIPNDFALAQSYPNPFNASTTIQYSLPTACHVNLEIYDLMGNRVTTLLNGMEAAGFHQILWQAGEFASGTYLYRIQAGDYVMVKKTTLIK
jgi:hypothetical protein